jgi:hypothetical protein
MIHDLITGITEAIRSEFAEETYCVYTESPEEGAQVPYFYILCVNQSHNAKLGGRFTLNSSFDVAYFPSVGNNECWEVAEKLRALLDQITVGGDLIQGTSINYGVDSGVLHFLINYNLPMVYKEDTVEFMEEVTVNGKVSETGNN